MNKELKSRKHPMIVVLMLLIVSPLGLYWMYGRTGWPNLLKHGILIAYIMCLAIVLSENT